MPSLYVASRRVFPGLMAVLSLLPACSRTAAPPEGSAAVPVTVVTLATESVTLTRELPGRTTPYLVAEVRPQVNGIVARRLFTEGGLVKAGQPLYQLDDATYRADDESARAESRARRGDAGHRPTECAPQCRAGEDRRGQQAGRRERGRGAAPGGGRRQVPRGPRRIAPGSCSAMHASRRRSADASASPPVTQGALVTANQDAALATVQQLDPIYVDVTQSSAELLELRRALAAGTLKGARDLPVQILLEDGTRYEHDGKLAFSDVTVDPTTGSFALRVVVPNPDHVLLPGMYVRAVVGDGERENALLVPQQGVTRDPKGQTTAMVVGRDDKVEVRSVKVSRAIGDKWLVDDGLAAGDNVIVEGLQKIRPGAPVQATEAGAAPAAAAAGSRSRKPGSRMARFFIDRPIFAWVIAIIIMLAGGLSITQLPVSRYPNIAPPSVIIQRDLSGRLGQGGRGLGHADHRAEHEGARRPHLHVLDQRGQRPRRAITLTFDNATNPDIAQVQVQNKLQLAMPLLPQAVQRQGINVSKSRSGFLHGRGLRVRRRQHEPQRHLRLRHREPRGSAEPRPGRRQRAGVRRAVRDAHLARSEQARHLQPDARPTSSRPSRRRTRRSRSASSAARRPSTGSS